MSVLRTIECDSCGHQQTEKTTGEGWQGWGCIRGVSLNGVGDPNFCPSCLFKIMTFVDDMAEAKGDSDGMDND